MSTRIRNNFSKVKIKDLCFVKESELQQCIKLVKEDLYARAAIEANINFVLQGGFTVKMATVTYNGFDGNHENKMHVMFERFIFWYYTVGFVPFSINRYKSPKDSLNSNSKKAKLSQNTKSETENNGRKIPLYRQMEEFKGILPGLSSQDTTNSEHFDSFLRENLAPSLLTPRISSIFGGDILPIRSSSFTSSVPTNQSTDSGLNVFSSLVNGDDRKLMAKMFLEFREVRDITDVDAEDGDLDFSIPELGNRIGVFARYTEYDTNEIKVFLRRDEDNVDKNRDKDSDSYSSSSESDSVYSTDSESEEEKYEIGRKKEKVTRDIKERRKK